MSSFTIRYERRAFEIQFSTIMSSENTTVIMCLAEIIIDANKLRDPLEIAT